VPSLPVAIAGNKGIERRSTDNNFKFQTCQSDSLAIVVFKTCTNFITLLI
jgi:hypothetical protein